MQTRKPYEGEEESFLNIEEDHFNELKAKEISPSSLQKEFVSFANVDGGDLYVGIKDISEPGERIDGFSTKEDADAHIHTLLENTAPAVENIEIEFIDFEERGYVLHFNIPKSPKVHYAANGNCYIRVNSSKKRIKGKRVTQLNYSKGVFQYENQTIKHLDIQDVIDSPHLKSYMSRINTDLPKRKFLKKQRLIQKENNELRPNVACVLLFDESPQASLSTRCGIKVYRLRTTDSEYKREHLEKVPTTIEGPIENQVEKSLTDIDDFLKNSTYYVDGDLVKLVYPIEALKEILVNAVIHRDYSLNDDIHVRIYDNRIEIQSPGKLPGYMTIDNLYEDRFSRNPKLVRMLHKLPNPLNHDIGEGLDTARNELKKVGLVPPTFEEKENAFLVTVKHQKLASVEDVIMKYLKNNPDEFMTNRLARSLSGEEDRQRVKTALQKLRADNKIKPEDPNASPFDFRYELVNKS